LSNNRATDMILTVAFQVVAFRIYGNVKICLERSGSGLHNEANKLIGRIKLTYK